MVKPNPNRVIRPVLAKNGLLGTTARFAELLLVRALALQIRVRVPRVVAVFVRKNESKKSTAKLSYANFRLLVLSFAEQEAEHAKVSIAELCSDRASTVINFLG